MRIDGFLPIRGAIFGDLLDHEDMILGDHFDLLAGAVIEEHRAEGLSLVHDDR
jgi:hypothetical protein